MQAKLIYTDEKTSKFWEIAVEGPSITVRFGRVGTFGQRHAKHFEDNAAALQGAEKQIKAKLKKGYEKQGTKNTAKKIKGKTEKKAKTPRRKATGKPFPDLREFDRRSPPREELKSVLARANWAAFKPAEDLPLLRRILMGLEAKDGVGDLHKLCSEKVLALKYDVMFLSTNFFGVERLHYIDLSPDGKKLAVAPLHEDMEEGVLQVWEVETGRPVNERYSVPWGIGSFRNSKDRCLQWSPDGEKIGAAYNGNGVGVFSPYDSKNKPATNIDAAPGNAQTPNFCWSPDGTRIAVASYFFMNGYEEDESVEHIGCCIAPVKRGDVGERFIKTFSPVPVSELPREFFNRDGKPDLQPHDEMFWSANGRFIYGYNSRNQLQVLDVVKMQIAYLRCLKHKPAFNADGTLFAMRGPGKSMVVHELATGELKQTIALGAAPSQIVWAPGQVSGGARKKVASITGNRVFVINGSRVLYEIKAKAPIKVCVWSPDGKQLALHSLKGMVEIWSVGAKPVLRRKLKVSRNSRNLLWGANDVLIGYGENFLEFVNGKTGAGITSGAVFEPYDYTDDEFIFEDAETACLLKKETKNHWAIIENNGVQCPSRSQPYLNGAVHFSVEKQWAWPWHWARDTKHFKLEDLQWEE